MEEKGLQYNTEVILPVNVVLVKVEHKTAKTSTESGKNGYFKL